MSFILSIRLKKDFFKRGNIEFPLRHLIPSPMFFVGAAERGAVFGVAAAVDFHKMRARFFFPAHKLRSADMYDLVAGAADGDYTFEFLHALFFVVRPPFVRFEAGGRRAADGAFAARKRLYPFFYVIPLRGGKDASQI